MQAKSFPARNELADFGFRLIFAGQAAELQ
jgi:hypothetical protein